MKCSVVSAKPKRYTKSYGHKRGIQFYLRGWVGMGKAKKEMKARCRFLKYFRRLGQKRKENTTEYYKTSTACWKSLRYRRLAFRL